MHELKGKIDKKLSSVLMFLETLIAIFSVLVLVGLLVEHVWFVICNPDHLLGAENSVTTYLHHMMDIVIGLEFVKLLMHLTPGNILEVLTMALSRGIIVNHGTAVDNLLSIACIIGMFAARRFLIPRAELYRDLDEAPHEPNHHRRNNRRYNQHKKDDHLEHHADTVHH